MRQTSFYAKLAALVACFVGTFALMADANAQGKKPNIVVIWGDDIGQSNISAYTHGLMGYQTPNIDRIADEGVRFLDAYEWRSFFETCSFVEQILRDRGEDPLAVAAELEQKALPWVMPPERSVDIDTPLDWLCAGTFQDMHRGVMVTNRCFTLDGRSFWQDSCLAANRLSPYL